MSAILDKLARWLRRTERSVEGAEPVATPPPGREGEQDGETSTNAQMEGASDEPWPGSG